MGVHVNHVAIRATDIEKSASHAASALGLTETLRTEGSIYLTANEKHHELQLIAGDEAGFDHVGLEVDAEEELDRLTAAALAHGATLLTETPDEPGLGKAVRLLGPADIVVELVAGMERAELGLPRFLSGHARKLGHLTFGVVDPAAVVSFFTAALGLRVSDTEGGSSWLRCDADHHGLAFYGHATNQLHHYAFDLGSWSNVQRYLDDLAVVGQTTLWGPGRHGPGHNIFTYVPDPDGCLIEAYAELHQISNDDTYVPTDWTTVADPMNLWGPARPEGFADFGIPNRAPQTAPAG